MTEKIIYTVLILLTNFYIYKLMYGKVRFVNIVIVAYIFLFFGVIAYLSKQTTNEYTVYGFSLFLLVSFIYGAILAIFREIGRYVVKPKPKQYEFRTIDKKARIGNIDEDVNENNVKTRWAVFWKEPLHYADFINFIGRDLPILLFALFQLSIIWYPEIIIKYGEYLFQEEPIYRDGFLQSNQ